MDYRVGTCQSCQAQFQIPASFSAARARCKQCRGVVVIAAPVHRSAEEENAPARAPAAAAEAPPPAPRQRRTAPKPAPAPAQRRSPALPLALAAAAVLAALGILWWLNRPDARGSDSVDAADRSSGPASAAHVGGPQADEPPADE